MNKILVAVFIVSTSIFFVACNKSTPSNPSDSNITSSKITVEQAKDIALKHDKIGK